jgi:hypothetical protein
MIRATSESRGGQKPATGTWCLSLALFALLATLILLFSYAAACFDQRFNAGQWLNLGAGVLMMVVFPPLGACCCVLALVLMCRRAHRLFAVCALVIALLLGFPVTAELLARGLSAPAAYLLQPFKDAFDKAKLEREPRVAPQPDPRTDAKIRHYDALAAQFAEPQVISHADRGMILLADHKIVKLYGIYYSRETTADLMTYVSQNLINKHVVIRLPDRESFMKWYSPGISGDPPPNYKPEFFARSPRDAVGYRYGAIPCLVYVDGRLLNSRYKGTKRSLSDFSEYETQSGSPALAGSSGGRN